MKQLNNNVVGNGTTAVAMKLILTSDEKRLDEGKKHKKHKRRKDESMKEGSIALAAVTDLATAFPTIKLWRSYRIQKLLLNQHQ